ncbi:uncharacterized protein LOC126292064 isoform X2 [Schistocerca gregaria]|uniref:uncharacterized protein LOC126292064 isoform X2 n=1 Tax=Schistocerca gregaria TaxID=7010 RepID=UPI00211E1A52|nr:uncharacterized protein LOC126292064 isoform X2 [Schistocerca gregaria]
MENVQEKHESPAYNETEIRHYETDYSNEETEISHDETEISEEPENVPEEHESPAYEETEISHDETENSHDETENSEQPDKIPEKHGSSADDEAGISQEPEEDEPPFREIEFMTLKEGPPVDGKPHATPNREIQIMYLKEYPAEDDPNTVPYREIEFISIKEGSPNGFPFKKRNRLVELLAVTDFCCGCTLRTGSIITAVLFLVWSLAQIAAASYALFMLGNTYPVYTTWAAIDKIVIAYLTYYVIEVICDIILIIGAVKDKTVLFLPWMIIQVLVDLLLAVVGVIAWAADFWYELPFDGLTISFSAGIYLFSDMYFLRVVYSYYRTLQKSDAVRVVVYERNFW